TYDKTVDCGNGSGPLGSGLQVLVGQSAITCTITNTAASGNVTLVKKWVNSISGDSTTLGITAEGTTANATATTAGGDVTSAQQATKKVTAGASVSLDESTPGPKGSYVPQWSCDNGVTLGA